MHFRFDKLVFIFLVVFFISTITNRSCYAFDSTKTYTTFHVKKNIWQDAGHDLKIFFGDWGNYLTFPLRMKGKDWLVAGGILGGTAI